MIKKVYTKSVAEFHVAIQWNSFSISCSVSLSFAGYNQRSLHFAAKCIRDFHAF